ncbi:MAG: hypothetical protein H6814_09075 [Phycisphaeraceae bacterium]|nr:hypothetical protein [Phycisphaeraceae bacterium]
MTDPSSEQPAGVVVEHKQPPVRQSFAEGFATRVIEAAGGSSRRKIASLIADHFQTSAETVRRYLNGDTPSAEFILAICEATGTRADWLLFGRGERTPSHEYTRVLREADAIELVEELLRRVREKRIEPAGGEPDAFQLDNAIEMLFQDNEKPVDRGSAGEVMDHAADD